LPNPLQLAIAGKKLDAGSEAVSESLSRSEIGFSMGLFLCNGDCESDPTADTDRQLITGEKWRFPCYIDLPDSEGPVPWMMR
jgi:hypothetical protein